MRSIVSVISSLVDDDIFLKLFDALILRSLILLQVKLVCVASIRHSRDT
jgi:hypothetical protein